jgi:ribosomal protein S18 acetylase RimI-like enzyme
MKWVNDERIECVYFLGDPGDQQTLELARTHAFDLTDVKVTLDRSTEVTEQATTDPGPIRPVARSDLPALRAIAAVNHRASRFYYDRHFSRRQCDELFATWIENSCLGYADQVLVAERHGEIAAYVTLHLGDGGRGSIGLFGVTASEQGNRIGAPLIRTAIQWLGDHRVGNVDVVTQGRNVRALRFYQRAGFLVRDLQLWYHWWIGAKAAVQ